MPATRIRLVAASSLALAGLLGCAADEPAGGGGAAPPGTSTTLAPTTTGLPDEAEEGDTGLEQLSLELLVVPSDLAGQTFTDAGYVPDEGPNPCGVDVDADHPPSTLVGTSLVDADGRSIVEELRVYADLEAAGAAFEVHRTALACGTDGAGTTFGEPVDVNDVVGADAAAEVAVVTEDEGGVVIAALVGDAVLSFRIAAPAATPAALDPREVAAFGVGKVLAALEAG